MHERCALRGSVRDTRPADDTPGVGIDDKGDILDFIKPAQVATSVKSEHPERVRPRCLELPIDVAPAALAWRCCCLSLIVRSSRPWRRPAASTPCIIPWFASKRSTVQRATPCAFPPQLPPNLARAVDLGSSPRTRGRSAASGRHRAASVPRSRAFAWSARLAAWALTRSMLGRSAAPRRSARPHTPRGDRR